MRLHKLLIANRGEIAIRIARAAEELGIATLLVFPQDDQSSLHTQKADESQLLTGEGARAYLDGEQLVEVRPDSGPDGQPRSPWTMGKQCHRVDSVARARGYGLPRDGGSPICPPVPGW